jgi:hypothetical protein
MFSLFCKERQEKPAGFTPAGILMFYLIIYGFGPELGLRVNSPVAASYFEPSL